MEKYYFLYKDAIGNWRDCISPIFIAEHQHCRAIPKEIINDKLGYEFIADLIYAINNNDNINQEVVKILAEYNIHI